jgi:hypothetical protein
MANLERSREVSPYHYCMKCWRRKHISELTWQQGYLVCDWDLDKPDALNGISVLGEGDMVKMRTIMNNPQLELEPDRKLLQPYTGGLIEDIIL